MKQIVIPDPEDFAIYWNRNCHTKERGLANAETFDEFLNTTDKHFVVSVGKVTGFQQCFTLSLTVYSNRRDFITAPADEITVYQPAVGVSVTDTWFSPFACRGGDVQLNILTLDRYRDIAQLPGRYYYQAGSQQLDNLAALQAHVRGLQLGPVDLIKLRKANDRVRALYEVVNADYRERTRDPQASGPNRATGISHCCAAAGAKWYFRRVSGVCPEYLWLGAAARKVRQLFLTDREKYPDENNN